MTDKYGYGELEDQLIAVFISGAPDLAAAEKLLEQGADINASGSDPGGNILSRILEGYWQHGSSDGSLAVCHNCEKERCYACEYGKDPRLGENMLQIIEFFLAHGFDVNRKNGRYGAQCLFALVLSTFDEYTLIATKRLLAAGTKSICIDEKENDNETPWEFIGAEGSFQRLCEHDHHMGNLYEAIYQVYQAVDEGRPYAGIDIYTVAIGKRIVRVLAEKPESGEVFFDLDLPSSKHKNCYRQTLYFMYDGGMLITTPCADLWTDTALPEKPLIDVSQAFPGIVGSAIKQISFGHNEIVEGTTHYGQPVVMIEMESGAKLTLSINFGEVKEDENRAAYFTLQC